MTNTYVSRAGEKLAEAAEALHIDFRGQTVLDVGSSTGGFTDYALQHGAKKVIAIEKGTNQLHSKLRYDNRVELYEKTDILTFTTNELVDTILVDVSFTSLVPILNYLHSAFSKSTFLAMLKPQFEASPDQLLDGVVKNSKFRRHIIKDFEQQIAKSFKILAKKDNRLPGKVGGNIERFYLLQPIR